MNTNVISSKIRSTIGASSVYEACAFIYNDCKDTVERATASLAYLADFEEFLTQDSILTSDFNDYVLSSLPFRCTMPMGDGAVQIGYITCQPLQHWICFSDAENNVLQVICRYHDVGPSGEYTEIDSINFGGATWSIFKLADSLQTSEGVSSLICDACSTLTSNTGSLADNFELRIKSYVDKLTGSARAVLSQIRDALSSGTSSRAALLTYLVNIYKSLTNVTLDTTNDTMHFNDTEYYVDGFFGTYLLKAVVEVGLNVLSAFLFSVSRVATVAVQALSAIVQAFFNWEESQAWCSVDMNAIARIYAQPVVQAVDSVSAYFDIDGTLLPTAPKILSNIVDTGSMVVRIPGAFVVIWRDETNISAEAYVCFDIGWTTSEYQNTVLADLLSVNTSTWNVTVNALPSDTTWRKRIYDYQWLGSMFYNSLNDNMTSGTDDMLRGGVINNLFLLTSQLLAELVKSDGYDHYQWERHFPDLVIPPNSVRLDAWVSSHSSVGDYTTIMGYTYDGAWGVAWTWTDIVNGLFPVTKHVLAQQIAPEFPGVCLGLILDICDDYDAAFAEDVASLSVSDTIETDPDAYDIVASSDVNFSGLTPWITPPKYDRYAFMRTVLVGVAVAAACVGIGVGLFKLRRKVQLWAQRRQLDVERLRYEYEDNPTDENWNKYVKSLKRYNLSTLITGYSRLSYVNGYEIDSSGSLETTLDGLANVSQNVTVDNTEVLRRLRSW